MLLVLLLLLLLLLLDAEELLIGRQPTAATASRGWTSKFPQATTAAEFPAAVHDALALDGLLTADEKEIRRRVRAFAVRPPGLACKLCSCSSMHVRSLFHSKQQLLQQQAAQHRGWSAQLLQVLLLLCTAGVVACTLC
jgi:hypothetical protein